MYIQQQKSEAYKKTQKKQQPYMYIPELLILNLDCELTPTSLHGVTSKPL